MQQVQLQQAQLQQAAAQQAALQYQQQLGAQQQLAMFAQFAPQPAMTAAMPMGLAAQGPVPQEIPGVTDVRFEGKIVMVNKERTFGFIGCPPEISEAVGRKDLFIHKADVLSLQEGDAVSFGVRLHKDGRPQARDILPSTNPAPSPAPALTPAAMATA